MKKLVYVIILFIFSIGIVKAAEAAEYVSVVPDCVSFYADNEVYVPVSVKAIHNGLLSNKISKYMLGKIYNSDDVKLEIRNVSNNNINIIIDKKTDSDSNSEIYFTIKDDMNLELYDKVVTFDLVYTFKEIPKSISMFENKVYINEGSVCQHINDKFTPMYTKENDNHDLILYIIIGILGLVCIVLSALLVRRTK